MNVITGRQFGAALVAAGVLTQEELNVTRRIVIDAPANGVVTMYLERDGDERLLNVRTTLEGFKIETAGKRAGVPGSPEAAAFLRADHWIDGEGTRHEVR